MGSICKGAIRRPRILGIPKHRPKRSSASARGQGTEAERIATCGTPDKTAAPRQAFTAISNISCSCYQQLTGNLPNSLSPAL
jgi:hypothetical protein